MKPVNARRMCELLDEKGFVFVGQNGSHRKFRSPITGKTVIVPDHGARDLTPGTQRRIMRDAEIEHSEL